MKKSTIIILTEFGIILFIIGLYFHASAAGAVTSSSAGIQGGFLSQRVYSGILVPDNHLLLNLNPLQDGIKNYIKQENLNASVYILNLVDSSSFSINGNLNYEPASLNKLLFAMLIMKKIDNKQLGLDTVLEIKDQDRDSGSGSLYNKDIAKMKVRDLVNWMLNDSDNTAFNVLKEQINPEDVISFSNYLGFYGITGDNILNSHAITTKSISHLFTSLYLSTFLSINSSEYILSALSNSTFDIKSYANLPEETVVAQKYGNYYTNNSKTFNDCGIIYYKNQRFFYCIMTNGTDGEKAIEVISIIVKSITDYIDSVSK